MEDAEADFEKIIEEVGAEYLFALLQSSDDGGDGINADMLEELGRNPEYAEVLKQLQETELNDDTVPIPSPPASFATHVFPGSSFSNKCEDKVVLKIENQDYMKQCLGIEYKEGEVNNESSHPDTVIKTEGVPISEDQKDLRLSNSIPVEPLSHSSNQLPVHEIKTEKSDAHHHRHKEKKDKDREERKREKRLRLEKEREKQKNFSKPHRHPDFLKYKKKYLLLDTSVTVVRVDTILHNVQRHMRIKRRRLSRIEEIDRQQQSVINQKDGKIRLVPQPRPAFPPYKPDKSSSKRHGDKSKENDKDGKRRKIFVVSDSDSELQSKSKTFSGKKTEKDHRKVQKPHGEYSATGTRILPFEKRPNQNKEQERIRRPKMPEREPEIKMQKGNKKERDFSWGGTREGEQKLRNLMVQAALDRQKVEAQIKQGFRIPKNRQAELDRDQVSTSTPLSRLRQGENLSFHQRGGPNRFNRPSTVTYPPNSYGYHKYNQQQLESDDPGFSSGVEYNLIQDQRARELKERVLRRAEADFDPEEEDNPLDMHDDLASDEGAEPPEPQPPVDVLKIGPLVVGVSKMLEKEAIEYPTFGLNPSEQQGPELSVITVTVQKCAWWFQGIDKSAVAPILTVPINPEADDVAPFSDNENASISSFGNVSNPGNNDCQIYEITSSDPDPDVLDEYCGCSLINAEFRISADGKFQRIFDLGPGSNYEKEKFNATCTICNEAINGKRDLGRHVRSENHRINFKRISLTIMPNAERKEPRLEREEIVHRVARDGSKGFSFDRRSSPSKSRRISITKSPDRFHRRRSPRYWRSRSRSRSPEYSRRRRSPSPPRRRSTSAEKVAEFLAKTNRRRSRSRSPYDRKRPRSRSPARIPNKKTQGSIFTEKLKLQHAGKWTEVLETRWKAMEAEEKKLPDHLEETRLLLCDKPEDHPKYEPEWRAYWEKTYQEVELAGHNADTYDYVPGWKIEWTKLVKEILLEEKYSKMEEIQLKHGMDLASLQRILLGITVAPVSITPEVGFVPVPVPADQVTPLQEIYTPFEDDLTARSMSLSMSGSSHHTNSHEEPLPPGVRPEPNKPVATVTVDTVQKTWELLTGQKIVANAGVTNSNHSGSSVSDLDFEMDLIQVLRLMNGLEDQLSILASQVNDYFIRAEKMEQMQNRKSYDLLEDKDFVALLFQCRDKFMGLIRANILTRDVLKRMNKAVYGLNSILDSEQCQRLRPKSIPDSLEVEVAEHEVPPTSSDDMEIIRRPPPSNVSEALSDEGVEDVDPSELFLPEEGWQLRDQIQDGLTELSDEAKHEIATIVTSALVAAQMETITDMELVTYLHDVLEPCIERLNLASEEYDVLRRSPSPVVSLEGKREAIHGIGSALPILPEIQCRAISPPMGNANLMIQQFQQVRRGGLMEPRQFIGGNGTPPFSPRGMRIRGRGGRHSAGSLPEYSTRTSPYSPRRSLGPSWSASPGRNPRYSSSPRLLGQPEPGSSRSNSTEMENIPPSPPPQLINYNNSKESETRVSISQEFQNLDVSPISAESNADDQRDLVKRGSRSTFSNGSNGSRTKLKEVQKEGTPPPLESRLSVGGHLEDIVSDPESGEIVSGLSDISHCSSSSQQRRKHERVTESSSEERLAEFTKINDRIAAMKLVEELRRDRRRRDHEEQKSKERRKMKKKYEDLFRSRSREAVPVTGVTYWKSTFHPQNDYSSSSSTSKKRKHDIDYSHQSHKKYLKKLRNEEQRKENSEERRNQEEKDVDFKRIEYNSQHDDAKRCSDKSRRRRRHHHRRHRHDSGDLKKSKHHSNHSHRKNPKASYRSDSEARTTTRRRRNLRTRKLPIEIENDIHPSPIPYLNPFNSEIVSDNEFEMLSGISSLSPVSVCSQLFIDEEYRRETDIDSK